RHFDMLAEMRDDVALKHVLVILTRACAQAREVFFSEARDQGGNGWRAALGLDVGQRITALVNEAAQPLRFIAGVGRCPVAAVADGIAALTAAARHVVEHETPSAVGGDASAETLHVVVVVNLAGALLFGQRQAADGNVGQAHGSPCPLMSEPYPTDD